MTQIVDGQMLLHQVRLLLNEGRNEDALSTLQDIRAEDALQKEVMYLTGWCYIQMSQWNSGIQTLMPLLVLMNPPAEDVALLERERLTLCLLYLGLAAMSLLCYEDASLHLTRCLKVLHDRRVHLPIVRIRVRSSLAQTCVTRGLYATAVRHYEEALRLCYHYSNLRELPVIYYGLCDAHSHIDEITKANLAGQQALHLYRDAHDHYMEACTLQLLGYVSCAQQDYAAAADHYTQSLHLACEYKYTSVVIMNYIALVDLSMIRNHLDEAQSYCEVALRLLEDESADAPHLRAETYRMSGKVAQLRAFSATGAEHNTLLEEASLWYEKAVQQTAWATSRVAEVYEYWAQTLEALGRPQEALKRWHFAYALLSLQGTS